MHDSLIVSKVQATTCDLPVENRTNVLTGITAATFATAFIFVALRLYSKGYVHNLLGVEDWIVIVSLILTIPTTGFALAMAKDGFGRHLWQLMDGDLLKALKNFYIAENMYVWILASTKISILFFYLRVFPHEPMRFAFWGTMGLTTISTVTISLLTIFQCHPVSYFWNRDIHSGRCVDLNALAYANAAMSIIEDVLIVVLPIPIVAKLKMSLNKKLGIGLMFAIGSFGCIVSMIRLKALLSFGNSIDPTWDYTLVVIWTTLELAAAMICACLPALRRLFSHLFPGAFNTTGRSTDENERSSRHRYARARYPSAGRGTSTTGDESFIELQPQDGLPKGFVT